MPATSAVAASLLSTPEPKEFDIRIDALCRVVRVVDARSIDCSDGSRLRLALVETPAAGGPFDELVRAQLEELLPVNTNVPVEFDGQAGERRLAYFYLPDGRFINEELIRRGLAVVASTPADSKYTDRLLGVAEAAKAQSRGLWSLGVFKCTPAEYRSGHCGVHFP